MTIMVVGAPTLKGNQIEPRDYVRDGGSHRLRCRPASRMAAAPVATVWAGDSRRWYANRASLIAPAVLSAQSPTACTMEDEARRWNAPHPSSSGLAGRGIESSCGVWFVNTEAFVDELW